MAKKRLTPIGIQPFTMKSIIKVVIDGVDYYKPNKISHPNLQSRDIEAYYIFVSKNRMNLEVVVFQDNNKINYECESTIYLKQFRVHCEFGKATRYRCWDENKKWESGGYYFLNGHHVQYEEWLLKVRKYKLLKIESL